VNKLSAVEAKETEFPCQVVQVYPLSSEHQPPFRLDKNFRHAFRKAAAEYGIRRLMEAETGVPPNSFLRRLSAALTPDVVG
jgi:hypothetical protein